MPAPTTPLIRDSLDGDLPSIQAIYAHHVLHGTGSFEIDPPSLQEMTQRRSDVLRNGFPYVNFFRLRPAYRNTVENSIYMDESLRGRGIGQVLLRALLTRCEQLDCRQVLAVIGDSANTGSIALHARCGFRFAGTLRSSGWKFERWLDTVIMQKDLGAGDQAPPTRSATHTA
jgi:phosphinothricin acetyltransferase